MDSLGRKSEDVEEVAKWYAYIKERKLISMVVIENENDKPQPAILISKIAAFFVFGSCTYPAMMKMLLEYS